MLTINDLAPGVGIIWHNQPHLVVWREHVQMGRGGGIMRTKLKNLTSGTIIEATFKGNDRLAEADLTHRPAQFLYRQGEGAAFMDSQSFEQFTLPRTSIGEATDFLKDGMTVEVLFFRGQPLTATLPIKVALRVTYTEPGFKGDRVSAPTKPATLETGAIIQVPLFIKRGDMVRVDTRTGSYIERVQG